MRINGEFKSQIKRLSLRKAHKVILFSTLGLQFYWKSKPIQSSITAGDFLFDLQHFGFVVFPKAF